MISIEGRLPVSVNKAQLLQFIEGEASKVLPKPVSTGLFTVTPDMTSIRFKDIRVTNQVPLLGVQIVFELMVLVKAGFIKCKVKTRNTIGVDVHGTEISKDVKIKHLNVQFERIEISGFPGLFQNLILKKINSDLLGKKTEQLEDIYRKIEPVFSDFQESGFQIKGVNFSNLIIPRFLAVRDFNCPGNMLLLDMFGSVFIKNIRPGLVTEMIDIEKKEHPFEFNISIHQIFLKEVAGLFLSNLTIPIINRKLPLDLKFINIDENVMHVGFEISELLKGHWLLQLDVIIHHDAIRFSLIKIESTGRESIIDKGITKALEYGIEKLLKEYAEFPLSVIKNMIAENLKPSYRVQSGDTVMEVEVPDFKIQHVWLDQQSILFNAKWESPFYIKL